MLDFLCLLFITKHLRYLARVSQQRNLEDSIFANTIRHGNRYRINCTLIFIEPIKELELKQQSSAQGAHMLMVLVHNNVFVSFTIDDSIF